MDREFLAHQAQIVNMKVRDGMKKAEKERWYACKCEQEERWLLTENYLLPLT